MLLQNRNILIFDWTNLCLRTAWASHVKISETAIDFQVFNYSLWNSIYTAARKHKATAIILAADCGSWRPLIYPPYKQNRRLQKQKDQENGVESIINDNFFKNLNIFSKVLKENLPLIYLKEDKCEADDIIAITTKNLSVNNKVIVISGDCDYKQLLKYPNVRMWDPYPGKQFFVHLDVDPDEWVQVQALHGQAKDNIFNVFTRLDFPTEYNVMRESTDIKCIRKPRLTEKKAWEIVKSGKLEEFLNVVGPAEAAKKNKKIELENKKLIAEGQEPKQYYETNIADRYKYNFACISFDKIPDVLEKRVMKQLEEYEMPKESDHYLFFKQMHWNEPLDNFGKVDDLLNRLY